MSETKCCGVSNFRGRRCSDDTAFGERERHMEYGVVTVAACRPQDRLPILFQLLLLCTLCPCPCQSLKVPKFATFGHFWTRIYQLDVIWHLKLSPGMCLLWPFTTFFYLGTVATPVSWNKIAWKIVRSLKIRMLLLLLLCFASAEFLTEVNSTFPEFCFEDSVISCVLVRPNPTSLWNWLILFLSFLIIPVTTHLRSQLRMGTRQSSRLMRRRGYLGQRRSGRWKRLCSGAQSWYLQRMPRLHWRRPKSLSTWL